MDGVIAAEGEFVSEVCGGQAQLSVDADEQELIVYGRKVFERALVIGVGQPGGAVRGRQRRPALRIRQDARRDDVARPPQLGSQFGAVFDDDELDQG